MILIISQHKNAHHNERFSVIINTLVVVPGPTATTVACSTLPWDFSGIMMPPFVTVSAANRSTNTRSNMGRNFRKALAYGEKEDKRVRQDKAIFTSTLAPVEDTKDCRISHIRWIIHVQGYCESWGCPRNTELQTETAYSNEINSGKP